MCNELEECPRDFLKKLLLLPKGSSYYLLSLWSKLYSWCDVFCELLLDVIWCKISPEMNCDVAILHSPIY